MILGMSTLLLGASTVDAIRGLQAKTAARRYQCNLKYWPRDELLCVTLVAVVKHNSELVASVKIEGTLSRGLAATKAAKRSLLAQAADSAIPVWVVAIRTIA